MVSESFEVAHEARVNRLLNASSNESREALSDDILTLMIKDAAASPGPVDGPPSDPKEMAEAFLKTTKRGPLQPRHYGSRFTNVPVLLYLQLVWEEVKESMPQLDQHGLIDFSILVLAELVPEGMRQHVTRLKSDSWVALKARICTMFEREGVDTGSDFVFTNYFSNWKPIEGPLFVSCAALMSELLACPMGIPGLALQVACDHLANEKNYPQLAKDAERYIKDHVPRNKQSLETNRAFASCLGEYVGRKQRGLN
ncbi:hypothetical protein B0I72DRAFT_171777 [Yarrowia lipolytica]|jgi:hypothetical protein|uniref:YALI0E22132p n=2 Tax=Yarrowia lipolytica TaxID=4952 RepID=Q6C505_YARLI|nr:YALI0E22132p [Yarrowia lipolytica CLIB122]AOW05781.1 hypothetical protein YALI1_E26118g [Yarrowia lipolytica]KAB8285999.1 hypothetical protein BKA91DRAFT_165323 [Yarrowia lipolytica]KAE8171691.1 hypothetical protein BKA90DRAFT_138759 [Yarrowia lipolytica]KAJ8057231.1 hypothetical protein LXG23DRAFT_34111 [Yarrowia lipolytica]QNP99133.1 Hypothetical protein YALI2_E00449g [Yarrowia lipolytica]|eukprot:XP_504257.1 YALI0E22132p [Yarrowia lipolytica CLIB122]